MGLLLREEELMPDVVLCSTARRARKTVERLVDKSGYEGRVRHLTSLYTAGPRGIVRLVRALPDRCRRVLVVGHNPVLEDLVEWIAGTRPTLPTAALVRIDVDAPSWRSLGPRSGTLVSVWRPKELGD